MCLFNDSAHSRSANGLRRKRFNVQIAMIIKRFVILGRPLTRISSWMQSHYTLHTHERADLWQISVAACQTNGVIEHYWKQRKILSAPVESNRPKVVPFFIFNQDAFKVTSSRNFWQLAHSMEAASAHSLSFSPFVVRYRLSR